jgi:hypothetical protein
MGYIREPKNVDFVVSPSVFTEEDQNQVMEAIAEYKKTGKTPPSVEISGEDNPSIVRKRRSNSKAGV